MCISTRVVMKTVENYSFTKKKSITFYTVERNIPAEYYAALFKYMINVF